MSLKINVATGNDLLLQDKRQVIYGKQTQKGGREMGYYALEVTFIWFPKSAPGNVIANLPNEHIKKIQKNKRKTEKEKEDVV